MIADSLANFLNINPNVVDEVTKNKLSKLVSQTFPQERESLYALTKYLFTGEGDIWDIGCAAGGSSFCLAEGVKDNDAREAKNTVVKCFDLFDGYSGNVFKDRFPVNLSDLEIFGLQTQQVKEFVKPEKLDLATCFSSYPVARQVEVAHIDAAKSLELWKAIFAKISQLVIPGKTVWIFQDFERCRLPWQVYSLSELMSFGEIIGGAYYGTLYFRFNDPIADATRRKIIDDNFSLDERINNTCEIFDLIENRYSDVFYSQDYSLFDIENTFLAYIYYWQGENGKAKEVLKATSSYFLSQSGNEIYSQEINRRSG